MEQQQLMTTLPKRSLWLRVLLMLLLALAYQLCGTLLFIIAVIQFVLSLVNGQPNARLQNFSRALGRYLRQLVNFLSFAEEEAPFPFGEWPSTD